MDNFVVSARKYRPNTFDTVVGQTHITTTLKNAIRSNHLAQAFLFCGPRGVGKTTCARILAKTINCQNLSTETEACDNCDSCLSFTNSASFNIHELDAASNNSVDDIRNLVDQVRYPPQAGKYKIYIIDEVHMLSNSAFNAFLKTLEEPPSYAIFILATTEKHKIIPTILSRCQIFDFNRIQQNDISRHLNQIAKKEKIDAEEEALQLIAQKADGGLRDALSMFDLIVTFSSNNRITYQTTIENLHILDYDYYFRMTDYLLAANLSQALLTFDEILRNGFDGHHFVVGLCEHFRNLMVCKDTDTVKLLEVSLSVQKKYLNQSSQSSLSFLLSALNIGSQCDLNYKSSKNQRLHVELTLMKMAHIHSVLKIQPTDTVIELATDKKKVNTIEKAAEELEEPLDNAVYSNVQPTENKTFTSQLHSETITTVREPLPLNGYKPSAKLKSTIRLDGIQHAPLPVLDTDVQSDVLTEVLEDLPFGLEKLQYHWGVFAKMKEEQGKQSEFVILDRPFEIKEDSAIYLNLDNNVQLQQLNGLRHELLAFLRQQLQNQTVQLQAEVVVKEGKKVIYTSQDKFRHLSEKNPALTELRNAFGLDVDY
ncbi:MAG: DNA polymerase III subunit gamma/tau [Bacteroidota bacterium]